jgi:hypothetical protein
VTNPNTLPSFQAICTRRTSGHCPETFRAVDFYHFQCHNVASFTAQLLLFFIFFLFFFVLFFFFTNFFYLEKGLDRIFTNVLYTYPKIKFYLSVFKGFKIIFTFRGSVFHVKWAILTEYLFPADIFHTVLLFI